MAVKPSDEFVVVLPSVFIPASLPAFMPIMIRMLIWVIVAPSIWIIPVIIPVVVSIIKRMRIIIWPEYRLAGHYLHMRG